MYGAGAALAALVGVTVIVAFERASTGAAWSETAPTALAASTSVAFKGHVVIDVQAGKGPGPNEHASRGRFTIADAIDDHGRWFDRGAGRGVIVRTLVGAKGTIRMKVGEPGPIRCQCNWRITMGTKAYAGLRGRGHESGYYLPSIVMITMTGRVSQ